MDTFWKWQGFDIRLIAFLIFDQSVDISKQIEDDGIILFRELKSSTYL